MAKKEARTDLWVAEQLKECGIKFDPQGSNIKEVNEALKTASKRGTGNEGYPEYVARIGDFLLVIEDKASPDRHARFDDNDVLDTSVKAVINYAVNGAYYYAKHIARNSTFKKVFALGVSGDAKHHRITPLYVDDRDGYMMLDDLDTVVSFTETNVREYYTRNVLGETTDVEKTTEQILKDAAGRGASRHHLQRVHKILGVEGDDIREAVVERCRHRGRHSRDHMGYGKRVLSFQQDNRIVLHAAGHCFHGADPRHPSSAGRTRPTGHPPARHGSAQAEHPQAARRAVSDSPTTNHAPCSGSNDSHTGTAVPAHTAPTVSGYPGRRIACHAGTRRTA